MSVPDRRSNLDAGYKNKFHVNEMYIEHLLEYLKKYFNDVQIAFQVQRPASKVRTIIGKILSLTIPKLKPMLVKQFNKIRNDDDFTGTNFIDFFDKNAILLDKYRIVSSEYVDFKKDRICYVVIAKNI